jgi:hypothetical protein
MSELTSLVLLRGYIPAAWLAERLDLPHLALVLHGKIGVIYCGWRCDIEASTTA